ncbi:MAG TPA: glycosyltransferase family 2 protein [Casimicrobiaceae bacterium]|nr:glycosyltransferase family 2 protein [Casimicrobiaceae bacterium]
MTTPLTLCVITRDAASDLALCLGSVPFADEVLVVDSGSRDDTVELARRLGARVVEHAWPGFGPQKNFAIANAHNDWVLCLDADERLSPELAARVRDVLSQPQAPAASGYTMARRNRFLGRWLKHGEGYPDWNLRLFDRRRGRWSDDAVHEHVLVDGPVQRLRGDLLHASAESLENYLDKQNRYTTLQAQALHARGERPRLSRMLLSPLVRFVRFYFFRLGFLDGIPGLVHIVIGCGNSFMKYAKLRELHHLEEST